MTCDCERDFEHGEFDHRDEECVRDVVRRIIRAQRRAVEEEEDTCFTSCDRSIDELISPFEENRERLRHNTIPFILFCRGNCKPFIGSGVRRRRHRESDRHFFECVESPIFRAKKFVNDGNCVLLELLKPVEDRRHPRHEEHRGEHEHHERHERKTVCDFFPDHDIRNFRATGICITVDLNCFCGISCLEPITPLRARGLENEEI